MPRCLLPARPGGKADMNATLSWFAMGGYADFVWPAYGIAAAILGGLALYCWRRHRLSGEALARVQQHVGPRG